MKKKKKGPVKKLRRKSRATRTLMKIMAEEIKKEIDKEILKKLRKMIEIEEALNKNNPGVSADF